MCIRSFRRATAILTSSERRRGEGQLPRKSHREWFRLLTGGAVGARNLVSLGLGQFVFAASSWGIVSVIAVLGSAESVGQLAFALAIVTPTYSFAKLRLRSVIATDLTGQLPLADYTATALFGALLALPACLLIAAVTGADDELMAIVGLVALSRAFEAMSVLSYGYKQRSDEMALVGISVTTRGVLTLALVALAFAMTESVVWVGAMMAVGGGLAFAFIDVRMLGHGLRAVDPPALPSIRNVRRIVTATLPLGGAALLMSLTDNIPRLMLNSEAGLAELGVFATFGYVVTGAMALTRAINSAATPRIARAFAERDAALLAERIRGLVVMSSLIGASGLVLALAVGEPFLRVVFGPEFADYSTEFTLMAVYAWMVLVFAGLTVALVAARQFRVQLIVQVVTVVVVSVSAFVLIPDHGVLGAVTSLLVSGAARVLLTIAVVVGVVRSIGDPSDDLLGSSHG